MTSAAQRKELHRTIWAIANDLRGAVDGWDFKAYVLGMLFYRFISENIASYINQIEIEAGLADFDYASMDDAVPFDPDHAAGDLLRGDRLFDGGIDFAELGLAKRCGTREKEEEGNTSEPAHVRIVTLLADECRLDAGDAGTLRADAVEE